MADLRAEVAATHALVAQREEERGLLERFADAAAKTNFSRAGAVGIIAKIGGTAYFASMTGNSFRDGHLLAGGAMLVGVVGIIVLEWWTHGNVDEKRVAGLEAAFVDAAEPIGARVDIGDDDEAEDREESEVENDAEPERRRRA